MSTVEENFEFTLDQLSVGAFFTLRERADDRLVVGLILIPIIYGTIANIALIVTVMGSKDLRANPSYYLLIHIAACDLVMLFFETVYRLGGIVFRQAFLGSAYSPLNYTIPFFQQCAWWAFVFELTLTAVSRFVCIFFVGRYDAFFTRRTMLSAVLLTTILGILMSAPHLHPCCRVLWLFDAWTNSYFPSSTWYLQFDFIVTLTTIGIIFFSYLGVGWRLRTRQTTANAHRGRDQLLIALQVGLMCGIYILNSIMWNVTPYIEASKWTNIAFTSTNSLQCAVHPTIAFLFNSRIRKALIGGTSKHQQRASVTTSAQIVSSS